MNRKVVEIVKNNVASKKITDAGVKALYDAFTPGGSATDFRNFWMKEVAGVALMNSLDLLPPDDWRLEDVCGIKRAAPATNTPQADD